MFDWKAFYRGKLFFFGEKKAATLTLSYDAAKSMSDSSVIAIEKKRDLAGNHWEQIQGADLLFVIFLAESN